MFHQLLVHDSYQSLELCIFVYHQPECYVQPNPKLQQMTITIKNYQKQHTESDIFLSLAINMLLK